MTTIVVGITVFCKSQEIAVKVGELLNRAAAGIALEGIDVGVSYTTVDDEEQQD